MVVVIKGFAAEALVCMGEIEGLGIHAASAEVVQDGVVREEVCIDLLAQLYWQGEKGWAGRHGPIAVEVADVVEVERNEREKVSRSASRGDEKRKEFFLQP